MRRRRIQLQTDGKTIESILAETTNYTSIWRNELLEPGRHSTAHTHVATLMSVLMLRHTIDTVKECVYFPPLTFLFVFCTLFRVPHSTFRVVPDDRRDTHVALLGEAVRTHQRPPVCGSMLYKSRGTSPFLFRSSNMHQPHLLDGSSIDL